MKRSIRASLSGVCAVALAQFSSAASSRAIAGAGIGAPSFAEHQAQCAGKDGWSDAAPPVRIYGNVYDVGTCGIVVLMISGPQGNIVIDAAPADATSGVLANIERLGFRPNDVKVLLSTHEHVDHAGGMAELQKRTGARLMAVAAATSTLQSGVVAADDPQFGSLPNFTGARVNHVLRDGEIVTVGPLRLTAHATPGHAPGSTSWSWRSCDGGTCRAIVYADSLSAVSADTYRFSDHPAYVAAFKNSIAKIARLPCDLLVTPHPGASDLYGRMSGASPLSDKYACRTYAATSATRLDERISREAAGAALSARSPDEHTVEAVRAADDAWGKAEGRGDAAYVDWLLLPQYRSIGPSGKITSKDAIVAGTKARSGSADAAAKIAAWRASHPLRAGVSIFGDTAVLTWVSLLPSAYGSIASSDIFVYRDRHWHAVYSQHTAAGA